ncbi:hypothetical protein M378DRAFT_400427 [Amanita muscaria Koide BX008]|uniref:NACHT domain-containing protein n=1 Tax=Amanita muscaria (strain Koide BX008) TaxID=946122 RepID=A0A0C2WKE3_AMAMK|nr:hypothetical protein M378DRAFT_400427 [Amanita muscaria Koide BX008]
MPKPIGFGDKDSRSPLPSNYLHHNDTLILPLKLQSRTAMPMIEGASNFTISGYARLYEIHGNAVINNITDINELKKFLSIVNLPRAHASQKDYETSKKSGPCFPGTREALLREMMEWANQPGDTRMYVLSGLAGIGKSTVVYTVATQADELGLLAASFFFSRDEDDRNNARRFFTTVAHQLCVYDETFAKAIGDVLLTERGSAATTQNPQEQLKVLILDPLRNIVQSRSPSTLIVVDALDECDEEDALSVFAGLSQLVRDLPSFKVILTTRPFDLVLGSQDHRQIFHLQDIEDIVVDSDIRLYLQHSLSLEQVQRRYPRRQWCASDEEIDSLVRAVGRLFIIASTAVRYILDKSASNPAAQMQKLLLASAKDHTPFKDLDHFYTVILRNVVPENCDDHIVSRYRSVVGAIIIVQRPLPVSTLAHLINIDVVEICEVLDHLQSVILLGSDNVPRIYHKSFPDYLTDQARCKDPRLRIDTRIRHIQIAARCFEIMDKHLKRNILGLGDPARFMSNEDGLKEDGITEEQLQEKIPQQLRYVSVYWSNHLEFTNIEDADRMNGLERFVDEHMLHWFEVLSLIGKLELAHHAIGVVLKLLKSRVSALHQPLSDALRFIGKFYDLIKRSALHTYHSALPFTPSDSVLYRRYIKDAVHNLCSIEGGPEKWDALVANLSHGEEVDIIKFSLASPLFVSCSDGKSKVWDTATGTPISTIPGHMLAFTNNLSTVASSEDKTITFYDVNGSARETMIRTSSRIRTLALSSESSRVAAALSDGTIWLWDSGSAELIDCFNEYCFQLNFSPTGIRLACSSENGIKLRDGISGRFIADLRCGSSRKFEFSGDGSRIASVSPDDRLSLWNSDSGALIGAVRHSDGATLRRWAISANGSLLATADYWRHNVKLWSENHDHIAQIKTLAVDMPGSMTFSPDNILAISTDSDIRLYNVKTDSFIYTLPFDGRSMAFSPDCTRLAVGYRDGNVNLWDIRGIDVSSSPSKRNASTVTALALSRDCLGLVCGFVDGRVELWGTRPTKRRIALPAYRSIMEAVLFRNYRHPSQVTAVGFSPDGRLFASGSDDGIIKLWNGGDGALHGTLKAPTMLQAVALSSSVLVATWSAGVTLWSLDPLTRIQHHICNGQVSKVSIAENSTLIAICLRDGGVVLLDAVNRTTIATFDVPPDIHTMTFLPDVSQLVLQFDSGFFLSLNLINKSIKELTLAHLIQLPDTPLWRGVPIWHCQEKDSKQHYFSVLFSQHKNPVPVLWIPRDLHVTACTHRSSMIALGCRDGRVILVRLPTSHVS